MSDAATRAHQRLAMQGEVLASVETLVDQMRTGTLSRDRVRLAACLGIEAAREALGEEVASEELATCFAALGRGAIARALVAYARICAHSTPASVHALESWILCPSAELLEACRETWTRTQYPDSAAQIGALGISALEAASDEAASVFIDQARVLAIQALEGGIWIGKPDLSSEDLVDRDFSTWLGSWVLGGTDWTRDWYLRGEAGGYREEFLGPLLDAARALEDLDLAAAAQAHLAHWLQSGCQHLVQAIEHGRAAIAHLQIARSRPDLLGLAFYSVATASEMLREDDREVQGVELLTAEEEESWLEEAAALLEASDMPRTLYSAAQARLALAHLAQYAGDHPRASAELLRAVPNFERSGSITAAASALHRLGSWAMERGDFALARRSAETGIELTKPIAYSRLARRWEVSCWDLLGDALMGLARPGDAQDCYVAAHRHFGSFDGVPRRFLGKYRDLGFEVRG